jgi:hypothetical protein
VEQQLNHVFMFVHVYLVKSVLNDVMSECQREENCTWVSYTRVDIFRRREDEMLCCCRRSDLICTAKNNSGPHQTGGTFTRSVKPNI